MENSNLHITPSKTNLVFRAYCDYFGYIEIPTIYKRWEIVHDNETWCGDTFDIRFTDAINGLHEWLIENKWVVDEHPKAKFHIEMVDGSWNNKLHQPNFKNVYTISSRKAKQLLF